VLVLKWEIEKKKRADIKNEVAETLKSHFDINNAGIDVELMKDMHMEEPMNGIIMFCR
jgi:hypothetical protein